MVQTSTGGKLCEDRRTMNIFKKTLGAVSSGAVNLRASNGVSGVVEGIVMQIDRQLRVASI